MAKKKFDKSPSRPAQKIIDYLSAKNDIEAFLIITRMGQWKCYNHSNITPLTAGFVIGALGLMEIPGSSFSKELSGDWIFVLPNKVKLYKNN